jgi:NADH:ubiquinone oxidoreductase subunit 5 (subunit L)/multisubunit Na+/H+ antiporter MnhA subunit
MSDVLAIYLGVCFGTFTSLFSGLNALVEKDMKKIVALSTLSHLGFICTALFSGSVSLAFVHLVSHALFKSLLFMSVGDLIHLFFHSQDSRLISNTLPVAPISSLYINFSVFNLLGLPFIRGFYSKDMILESLMFSKPISLLIYSLLVVNLFTSFIYTLKLFSALHSPLSFFSLYLTANRGLYHSLLLSRLGLFSLVAVSMII